MRTALLTTALALSLLVTARAAPVPHVVGSLVKIYHAEDGGSECTAFAIRPGRYMTAAHCVKGVSELLVVYGQEKGLGYVLYADEATDLAIFDSDLLRPALTFGKKPDYGDVLMAFGFGFDYPVPIYFQMETLGEFEPFEGTGPRRVLTHGIVPGMSGGPVVNQNGDYVSVNQVSAPAYGLSGGATYASLKALLKKY